MIEDEYVRPAPEEILRRITADERDGKHGKLTIFFGYAPGVGKTYAMLYDAMLRKKEEKLDIISGYVQIHKRPETEEMLEAFEIIWPQIHEYNGLSLMEPDIPAILKRKPQIAIIDELAHTNAPGSKNPKRYMDVMELLNAGIDVYTTMNVQHLESLKDIMHQITDITITENIPDPVFIYANEVKLIDLPIDDLLRRLRDGKVYTKDMAQKAVTQFFKSENLLALRQIALRQVAMRIDKQMARYLKSHNIEDMWHISEKVLVRISPNQFAGQVVRAAYRLSVELDADMVALYVETDEDDFLTEQERSWLGSAIDAAKRLGVTVVTASGNDVGTKISSFANQNSITKIVLNKPVTSEENRMVNKVILSTEGIDVYILAGKGIKSSPDTRPATPLQAAASAFSKRARLLHKKVTVQLGIHN